MSESRYSAPSEMHRKKTRSRRNSENEEVVIPSVDEVKWQAQFMTPDQRSDYFDELSRIQRKKESKKPKLVIDHKPPVAYGLPPFEDLVTSTKTVMVYCNVEFDLQKLFHEMMLTDVEVPRTKKQKNVDKKRISAPYGAIIGVQSRTMIRGVDIRKKNKQWCTICRPETSPDPNGKKKKILTLTEFLVDVEGTDIRRIKYHCSKCQKDYEQHELKKIGHFLNQLTIVLSLGNQPILNIMMFKDNLKIAGCKGDDDAKEAVLILWEDYISKIKDSFKYKRSEDAVGGSKFVFETVMRNVDFKLGFMINREALNTLMNRLEFSDKVKMSQYEATANTNVNVKMHSHKPIDFLYDCMIFPTEGKGKGKGKPRLIDVTTIDYKKPKKPKRGGENTTFIVFSSSEIILSGRYDENMKEMYEFFVNTAFTRRGEIAERLIQPDRKLLESILRG